MEALRKLEQVVKALTSPPVDSGVVVIGPFRAVRANRNRTITFDGALNVAGAKDYESVDSSEVLALLRCGDLYYAVLSTSKLGSSVAAFVTDPAVLRENCEVITRLVSRYTVWRCDDGRTYSYMVDDDCQPIDKTVELELRSEIPATSFALTKPIFTVVTRRNARTFLETLLREAGLEAEGFGVFETGAAGGPMFRGPTLWSIEIDKYTTVELILAEKGIIETHWDDYNEYMVAPPGAYLAVSVPGSRAYSTFYAYAKLDTSHQPTAKLVEEARQAWEERNKERRKLLEEAERRRREKEQKIEELVKNRERLIQAIVSAIAEWADAAVLVNTQVLNVKKGRNGTIYTKPKWRPAIKDEIIVEALFRIMQTECGTEHMKTILVTKNGEMKCAKIEYKELGNEYYGFIKVE